MITVVLSLVSESVKGVLSRYLLEIASGVFVGTLSASTRDELWEFIRGNAKHGNAVMSFPDGSVTGYKILTHNLKNRSIKDFDGIDIVRVVNPDEENTGNNRKAGWSKQSKRRRYG